MNTKQLLLKLKWVQTNHTLLNYYLNVIQTSDDEAALALFYQKWSRLREQLDIVEETDKAAINARIKSKTVTEIPYPGSLTPLQEASITNNKARATIRVELDEIFVNKTLTVPLKNMLALEFLIDARGDMYSYVLSNAPDDVLLEWKVFYLNPFRMERHVAGLKRRDVVRFKVLKEVVERLPLEMLESLIVQNLENDLPLEEKICSVLILVNKSIQNEEINTKSKCILKGLIKQYKQLNEFENVPDEWVLGIVSEIT